MAGGVRAFVGLPLDEAAQQSLGQAGQELASRCVRAGIGARAVRPENLHLTLKFLGALPVAGVDADEVADALRATLAGLAQGPFEIAWSGVSAFPDEKKAHSLWARPTRGADAAKALAEQVDRCLAALGFGAEQRPYVPHITLVRVARGSNSVASVLSAVSPGVAGTSWVPEVVLYRSERDADGSRYTPLAAIALGRRLEDG